MVRVIKTCEAPSAIGPYSQAIKAGNLLFASGQIHLEPKSGTLVSGSIEDQTRQALENVKAILVAAGCQLEAVVKATVFIKNMDDFSKINSVYAEYFPVNPPARSCVEVARLPKDVKLEIEAIAVRK